MTRAWLSESVLVAHMLGIAQSHFVAAGTFAFGFETHWTSHLLHWVNSNIHHLRTVGTVKRMGLKVRRVRKGAIWPDGESTGEAAWRVD